MMLCEFCEKQWIMENSISSQKSLFELLMQISEVMEAF